MPIANVDVTNSLEYFLSVTNQLITAVNYFHANTILTPEILINPSTTGQVSLNIANGLFAGNGSLITSVPTTAFTIDRMDSARLQNTIMTILTSNGVSTNNSSLALGSMAWINLVAVDSITNTRTNLPLAVNAIITLISAMRAVTVNANSRTIGSFSQNIGGLGFTTYPTAGAILIGNTISGLLEQNTIPDGIGIETNILAGNVSVRANIQATANVGLTTLPGGGLQITQNGQPIATQTGLGVTQLNDTMISTTTTFAATANSLNAVSNYLAQQLLTGAGTGSNGRLLFCNVYRHATNTNPAGIAKWVAPPNVNISYLIVEVLGAGGSGGGAQGNVGSLSSPFGRWATAGHGGGAGGYIKGRIDNPANTYNVIVGVGGTTAVFCNVHTHAHSIKNDTTAPQVTTETIPIGALAMWVEVHAGGGTGRNGAAGTPISQGGGGGGYGSSFFTLTPTDWGKTMTVTFGRSSTYNGGWTNAERAGGTANVISGTYALTTINALGAGATGANSTLGALAGTGGNIHNLAGNNATGNTGGDSGGKKATSFPWTQPGNGGGGDGGTLGANNVYGGGGGGGGLPGLQGDITGDSLGGGGGQAAVYFSYVSIMNSNVAPNGLNGGQSFFGNNIIGFFANGGIGGANSRQLPRDTPNSSFAWPTPGLGRIIDIIPPFGQGGNVGNIGPTIVDIAAPGGNASPIIVLQGGRRKGSDIYTTIVGSGGGDPFLGGYGQTRRVYDFDEIEANNTGGGATSKENPETMADGVDYTLASYSRFNDWVPNFPGGANGSIGVGSTNAGGGGMPLPASGSGGGGRGAVIANNALSTLYGGNGRDGMVVIYAYSGV